MKRILGTIALLFLLNNCAGLPLVSSLQGSLSVNGAVGMATGKYEHQLASAVVNMASHNATGKTVTELLYSSLENKYTEKRLKKHFPNKDISWQDFNINNNHRHRISNTELNKSLNQLQWETFGIGDKNIHQS
tara:strand:- start:99 stop:497 length:399 start_codon:yes stop_codon:yes gene_type:complete